MKIFRTFNSFERTYFPKDYEQKRIEEIKKNPEEYGKYLAQQTIDSIKI